MEEKAMKRWYVGDVMTTDVVIATPDMGYKAVADLLVDRSVSALPVVDADGRVLGVVSEADLLAKLEDADPVPRHPRSAQRRRPPSQRMHPCGSRTGSRTWFQPSTQGPPGSGLGGGVELDE
jgi:CBS-domain-containing membrane protein